MSDPFEVLYSQTHQLEAQRDTLLDAQARIQRGEDLDPAQNSAVSGAKAGLSALGQASAGLLGGEGGVGGDALAVTAYVNYLDKQIDGNVTRLYSLDPSLAAEYYPDYLASNADTIKKLQSVLGGGGGGAPVQAYNFSIGPGGDIVRTNSVTGAIEITGQKVPQGSQVVTNTRDGHAYAVDVDTGDRTDLGVVAFPELDPERKFRFDVLSTAAQLEQSMAGIELQKRGQVLKAIGDDFANQVTLGRMVYEEASLNLDRIDKAFTQRREERAQLLKYAVSKSSLRMRDGQEMTALPFGGQLAGILSDTTGRQFSAQDFELPTTYISPDQTAQDVLGSSNYTSPIPGLAASMGQSRGLIEGVLGKPLGSQAATQQIVNMAVPGVGA